MRHALGTLIVVRCCWPCNISCVIYITVMWVFLTFVAKLLVLNNVCNDVEQPTFVCREKTCHTPYWRSAVLMTTDELYIAVVSLFHSSLKIRCLWKPKPIWYARCFLIFVMRKYGGIIKPIYFQNNTCVGYQPFLNVLSAKVLSYSGKHYDFEHYIPNMN